MADFQNPTIASLYSDMVDSLKDRDVSALKWLDGTIDSNLPVGAKRWNTSNNYFENFNGSSWNPLTTKYMIDVDMVDGCTINDLGVSSTDVWTASKVISELSTKLSTSAYTAADVLAKLLTVDGSGSGIDADLLDGQTGSYYNDGDNIIWRSTPTPGKFNISAVVPTGTKRLNYEGSFYPTSLNISGQVDTATVATHYMVETGSDGFIKPKTLANVKTEIVTKAAVEAVLTGEITSHTHKDSTTLTSLGITATAAELNYVDGVTSDIQTQLNTKAPLASPALTGTPTAPTAAAGTNTTQVATTAFVLANSVQSVSTGNAALSTGEVGTYALLMYPAGISAGTTYAGSTLKYVGFGVTNVSSGNYAFGSTAGELVTGTWRAMGNYTAYKNVYSCCLFLRIA